MIPNTYGFIGLGLIGGSIAKAIRTFLPDAQIIAYDTNPASLSLALREQTADVIYTESDSHAFSHLGSCEFIFLCAPVSENDKNLQQLTRYLAEDSILTDVGSVKNTIHSTINTLQLSHRFIGGHPMAGSEKSGYENSNESLLENAYYILTPGENVPKERIFALKALVTKIRAIPLILEADRHDFITAAISHLPHIIAAGLVNLVHDEDSDGFMKMIAAGGFKDITRIASSSPVMWQSICMTNTEHILTLLDDYIHFLNNVRTRLAAQEADFLYEFFDRAKSYRDSFNNIGSGPIKKTYVLYLDVPDKTGTIAQTATILADAHVSIKNIGIMHNREVQDGALRIEFYDEPSMLLAGKTLQSNQYTVFY